jgi:hypothetical protein
MIKIIVPLSLCFCLLLLACDRLDPEEPLPAYISIPSIRLSVKSDGSEGTALNKISDAWVYVDDELQGVYELPCKFPVLNSGSKKITIRAGILQNGIKATRTWYPFFNFYDTTFTLDPAKIHVLSPRVSYRSNTVFHLIEDFDGIGLDMEKSSRSDNDLYLESSADLVCEGPNSGKTTILPGTVITEIASSKEYVLPRQDQSVYLEMHYRVSHPFSIGVYANSPGTVEQQRTIILNPTIDQNSNYFWNKIYIDLSTTLSPFINATSFKIYMGAVADSGSSQPIFLFDNIKLISF